MLNFKEMMTPKRHYFETHCHTPLPIYGIQVCTSIDNIFDMNMLNPLVEQQELK